MNVGGDISRHRVVGGGGEGRNGIVSLEKKRLWDGRG